MNNLIVLAKVILTLQLYIPITDSTTIRFTSSQVSPTTTTSYQFNCDWTTENCETAFYNQDPRFYTTKQCYLSKDDVDGRVEPKNCAQICRPGQSLNQRRHCNSYKACAGKSNTSCCGVK